MLHCRRREVELDLTWEQVFARDNIVGGEVEEKTGDFIYRGRIEKVDRLTNGYWEIYLTWTARRSTEDGNWVSHGEADTVLVHDIGTIPEELEGGRIAYARLYGTSIIYPVGWPTLNPAEVEGIK